MLDSLSNNFDANFIAFDMHYVYIIYIVLE